MAIQREILESGELIDGRCICSLLIELDPEGWRDYDTSVKNLLIGLDQCTCLRYTEHN